MLEEYCSSRTPSIRVFCSVPVCHYRPVLYATAVSHPLGTCTHSRDKPNKVMLSVLLPSKIHDSIQNSKFEPSRPVSYLSGPELTRNLPNRISFFFFRFEFQLHLISQKMSHQAGILRIIATNQIQQSKKRLCRSNLIKNRNSIWGVCPPRHGLFCVTEAGHATWCHVVG